LFSSPPFSEFLICWPFAFVGWNQKVQRALTEAKGAIVPAIHQDPLNVVDDPAGGIVNCIGHARQ
jgi:hypothetical protein